jgi:NADH dehydrogenase
LATARNGQAASLPTLQVPDHPEVYLIGDLAYLEEGGHPLPMIAPVAIQQGVAAAQNIGRQLAGHKPLAFHYRDPGLMVTIGRNAAVAFVRGRCFTGFSAWLLWLSVHIYKLIGFRNRLMVLINWAWDYFLYERAVRLILPSPAAWCSKRQS